MSEFLLTFLRAAEGLRLEPYDDQGRKSIGYGHQLREGDSYFGVEKITQGDAEELLVQDANYFLTSVEEMTDHLDLFVHEREALVSLAFNVGVGAVQESTLMHLLDGRDRFGAAFQFRRWCRAGGKPSEYLLKRRVAEELWFLGGHPDSVMNVLRGVWT